MKLVMRVWLLRRYLTAIFTVEWEKNIFIKTYIFLLRKSIFLYEE